MGSWRNMQFHSSSDPFQVDRIASSRNLSVNARSHQPVETISSRRLRTMVRMSALLADNSSTKKLGPPTERRPGRAEQFFGSELLHSQRFACLRCGVVFVTAVPRNELMRAGSQLSHSKGRYSGNKG